MFRRSPIAKFLRRLSKSLGLSMLALAMVPMMLGASVSGCAHDGTMLPGVPAATVGTIEFACDGLALWCEGEEPLIDEAVCAYLMPGCQLTGIAVAQILNNVSASKAAGGALPAGFVSFEDLELACAVEPIAGCAEAADAARRYESSVLIFSR